MKQNLANISATHISLLVRIACVAWQKGTGETNCRDPSSSLRYPALPQASPHFQPLYPPSLATGNYEDPQSVSPYDGALAQEFCVRCGAHRNRLNLSVRLQMPRATQAVSGPLCLTPLGPMLRQVPK